MYGAETQARLARSSARPHAARAHVARRSALLISQWNTCTFLLHRVQGVHEEDGTKGQWCD
jgi:hypothetical protein